MTEPIFYIDRKTKQRCEEKVYFERWLRFFYGKHPLGRWLGHLVARLPLVSKLVGYLQSLPSSRKKIAPFVARYKIDMQASLQPIDTFASFNDFFIRKLKPSARPLASSELIIPCDGRILVYPNCAAADGFIVKGEKFCLARFLGSKTLAEQYAHGGMLLARLCPTDYHRFHFPCSCIPGNSRLINGWLHSVSPIALRDNMHHLTENKRMITPLQTPHFGQILYCEIGATNVGSIHQTYLPNHSYQKGEEKGFFSFGASALLLLFEQDAVCFEDDLCQNSLQHTETLCLFGQPLGNKNNHCLLLYKFATQGLLHG